MIMLQDTRCVFTLHFGSCQPHLLCIFCHYNMHCTLLCTKVCDIAIYSSVRATILIAAANTGMSNICNDK